MGQKVGTKGGCAGCLVILLPILTLSAISGIMEDLEPRIYWPMAIVGVLGTAAAAVHLRRTSIEEKTERESNRAWLSHFGHVQKSEEGFATYLTGFQDFHGGEVIASYVVTKEQVVFYETGGKNCKIGTIGRDSVKNFQINDHSQITKKIEVGAIVLFGPLALAMQSDEVQNRYYLILDEVDEKGRARRILFRGVSVSQLNSLASDLSPFRDRLSESEKVCPFCAEKIKREAVKCRFCGSTLE